jgi:hypothetical protein
MTRLVFVISILFGVVVARGQEPARNIIAEAEKTGIIESVLELETRNQSSIADFANIREVSSDNIEFIEPTRLSTLGFRVVSVASLNAAKQDHVVQYLLFKKLTLRDGVAIVVLSRVTEGRPCFAEPFSRERRWTYRARRTPVGWIAEVIARPASPISFTHTRSALWR